MSAVSAVVVAYDEPPGELRAAVDGILEQQPQPSEVLIVDNGARERGLAGALGPYGPLVRVLSPAQNLGFAGGVNHAAACATGEYLLCLNPDARAEPGCLEQLLAAATADRSAALVGAQVLLADGLRCNAGANPLHPTGISPSGGYGEPRQSGPPREVAAVSGACFLARREAFLRVGGFTDALFMYYDDVDLAWRLRLAGMRVVYCPQAAVRHGYEFARRPQKWFYLERNRLFSVLANYEARTLALLAPLLMACELGLLVVAARQGWLAQKLESYRSLLAMRRRLLAQRRLVQGSRERTDAALLGLFDDRLHSALLPSGPARLANAVCVPYMRLVRARLHAPARPDPPRQPADALL